jgi:RsiW-degrading membrane proteinase PrsW (M82 family)
MTAQPAPVGGGPTPGWGDQTSFVQRHQPAFWLFVVVLAICSLDFLSQQLQMISAAPTAWFVTVLLLVPYAVPVIAIIYFLDLYEHEPISILVAALLWGGIVATTLAMYTNTPLMELIFKITGDADFTNEWSAALTAPFVEELFKGLAVVLLVAIARHELDDVLDGFVWGAMVGIGFLLVEDVLYFVRAFAETGSMLSVFQMFMIRILGAGPYSHFLYTGLTGMGIAYYVVMTDRSKANRLLTGIGLIAAGVAAHFFWNSPILSGLLGEGDIVSWFVYLTAKGLPMLIGLVLVVRLARGREKRWFATLTAGFQDDGCITSQEFDELSGLRSRRRARNAAGREKGPGGKKIKGVLQRQQIALAMLFSKYGSESHPEVARQMGVVLGLKAEYAALGSAAPGAAGWGQPVPAAQPAVPGSAAGAAAGAGAWGQPAATARPIAQPTAAWGQAAATAGPVAQPAAQPATQPVAQPVAQPSAQPIVRPAPPPVVPAASAWTPTHDVPDGGLQAWAAPNPAATPIATLAAGLDVAVAERAGDWARVTAVNGWTGWVDARRLIAKG